MKPTIRKQPRRLATLTAVLERHWIEATPTSSPAGADAAAYLAGTVQCRQFALVSLGPEASPAYKYVDADFDTLLAAMKAASEHIAEAQHAAVPIEIVNLDTGERWLPEFDQLAWAIAPKEPLISRPVSTPASPLTMNPN